MTEKLRLYDAPFAPNPRRVRMFLAEKNVPLADGPIEHVSVNLVEGAHRGPDFRAKSPLAQVPCLEFPDGECLTESRAICVALEDAFPEPNLMGRDGRERARIEMWDRRAEFLLALPLMLWVRHCSPALAKVETAQNAAVGDWNAERAQKFCHWLDRHFKDHEWFAGDRFSIADITAIAGLDFAKLMKWRPDPALEHLARWRKAFDARPAGQVGP